MNVQQMVKAIQERLGLTQDGIAGPKTLAAIYEKICGTQEEPKRESLILVDERSARCISTLHVVLQGLAKKFLEQCNQKNLGVKIICGTRTYEEQALLYSKGRTTGGAKVTNAGPGQSMHNFGLAFDIGIFTEDGKYLPESSNYYAAGKIGFELGLDWGGYFKSFKDEPHFEIRPEWAIGKSNSAMLAELRRRKEVGTDALV